MCIHKRLWQTRVPIKTMYKCIIIHNAVKLNIYKINKIL